MTVETPAPPATGAQNPPIPDTTPPGSNAKLALDEFSQAMGDGATPPTSGDAETTTNAGKADFLTGAAGLEALYDIPVNITVVLGRTNIEVSELLALNKGDIVELDRKVGEAVDIFVNNRLVARGEVVLVEDRLGITMTEIIKSNQVS